jgi:flagellar biosynthesis protein FlhA
MADEFHRQVFGTDQPLLLAAGALVLMAAVPGLPKLPFLLLAAGLGAAGQRMRNRQRQMADSAPLRAAQAAPRESLESLMKVEPLAVEVGIGLVQLAEGGEHSPLLRRIAGIRRQLAGELGYLLPPVRVTDNLTLRAREYVILLKGAEIGRFELPAGCELAIPAAGQACPVDGVPTREPAFGLEATWIPAEQADRARSAGCTVVDPVSVLGTHLSELIRRHCHELFSRQDAKKFLDRVAEDQPKLVEDLVPKLLPLPAVQKVLQHLLRERIPIKDGATILEALGEAALITKNPVLLTEYVRQAMRRTIVRPLLDREGKLAVYLLDAPLEKTIEEAVQHGEHTSHVHLSPQRVTELLAAVQNVAAQHPGGWTLLTSSGARFFVRQMLEANYPQATVLSHGEIPPGVRVVSLGVLRGQGA